MDPSSQSSKATVADKEGAKKSWWAALPDALKTTTAIVVALAGLIIAVISNYQKIHDSLSTSAASHAKQNASVSPNNQPASSNSVEPKVHTESQPAAGVAEPTPAPVPAEQETSPPVQAPKEDAPTIIQPAKASPPAPSVSAEPSGPVLYTISIGKGFFDSADFSSTGMDDVQKRFSMTFSRVTIMVPDADFRGSWNLEDTSGGVFRDFELPVGEHDYRLLVRFNFEVNKAHESVCTGKLHVRGPMKLTWTTKFNSAGDVTDCNLSTEQ